MRRGLLLTIGGLAAGAGAARWLMQRQYESVHRNWIDENRRAELAEFSPDGATAASGAPMDGHGRLLHRVLVLGAGFGGVAAADRLGKLLHDLHDVDILMMDRENFHLFTPMLYQVATGGADPSNIIFAARMIGRNHHFRFLMGTVTGFDLDRRLVHTGEGDVSYDYLVVALGSVNNFFGIPGTAEHTLPLKTLADGIAIRNYVLDCFEEAEHEHDAARRRALLTFVVVGAGATGVEFVASLQEAIVHTLMPLYPLIDPGEVRVLLVEALPEILRGLPKDLAERALRIFQERGVEVRTGTAVAEIGPGWVRTKEGETIDAQTVVWAAGVKGVPVVAGAGGEVGRDGRVGVNELLQLPGHPEVYLVGDCARFIPSNAKDGRPLPPNAPVAIQQGEYVAERIAAALGAPGLAARSDRPFKYFYKGEMVALGRNEALAHVGPLDMTGFVGFLFWRLYYFSQLMGFKNRAGIFVDWVATYLYHRDVTRLPVERAAEVSRGGEERVLSAQQ
jgi:NADH:ubiquinone reductase (H+-translocating)